MRVSREQAKENRERIVDQASHLFRQRGFDGVGVADLMKASGLTHGGFYGHFQSKEQLMAEAVGQAMDGKDSIWSVLEKKAPDQAIADLIERYVSPEHRDDMADGCAMAALGPDAARKPGFVRQGLERGLRRFAGMLAKALPGQSEGARREAALAMMAQMVGAIVLARAVEDKALSADILRSVKGALERRGRV